MRRRAARQFVTAVAAFTALVGAVARAEGETGQAWPDPPLVDAAGTPEVSPPPPPMVSAPVASPAPARKPPPAKIIPLNGSSSKLGDDDGPRANAASLAPSKKLLDRGPLLDTSGPVPWEVGLIVSESLFGMLTAAGIALVPYYLLLRPMVLGQTGALSGVDPAVGTAIFFLLFGTVPLAVSQTEVALANGSKYTQVETWPAALAGLAAQAAVLGLFWATGGIPPPGSGTGAGAPVAGGSEGLLIVGTVVFVPLIEMAVLNLTKSWKEP